MHTKSSSPRGRRASSSASQSSQPSSYLYFGSKATLLLLIFFMIYILFLICFIPMMMTQSSSIDDNVNNKHDLSLKSALKGMKHVHIDFQTFTEHKKYIIQLYQNQKDKLRGNFSELNSILHEEMDKIGGQKRDELEKRLLDETLFQFYKLEQNREKELQSRRQKIQGLPNTTTTNNNNVSNSNNNHILSIDSGKAVRGFVMLGMHRSGTSMLAGLLVKGFGYITGGPLIQPAYDNPKGFFELIPAVLQNDVFMSDQGVGWSWNVMEYDADLAYQKYKDGKIEFTRGANAIKVLNDANNTPWLQKDPRMCITLRTWLPILNSQPAILFTIRHPLEVALSLVKRQGFRLEKGLKLWMQYNMLAIKNSKGLCLVVSKNDDILNDPIGETNRIVNALTNDCHVPKPPKVITQDIADEFVDSKLQHGKAKINNEEVLKVFGNDCVAEAFETKSEGKTKEREVEMYLKAMKMYCDFISGDVYFDHYEWPDDLQG